METMRTRDRLALLTAANALAPATPLQPVSPWQPDGVLAQISLSDLFGLDNLPVDRSTAMHISALSKARNLICGQIARFPLQVMTGSTVTQPQPPLTSALEPDRPRSTTITWIVDALLWWGRAFLQIVSRYAEDGRPRYFRFVPEWEAGTDGAGMLLTAFGKPIDPADWIRIDGPHEGVLNFAQRDIRDAVAIKIAVSHASDNPVPSINLHQTGGDAMTHDEITALVQAWADARRSGGVGYTNQTIEATAMGQAPEQLLIDARNQSAIDLARHCGLPAWSVDASLSTSAITYQNVSSMNRVLLEQSFHPYMDAICDRLSMDDVLARGVWLRMDTSQYLAGDFGTRMTAYATAIGARIYTAAECRALEVGIPLENVTAPTGDQQ